MKLFISLEMPPTTFVKMSCMRIIFRETRRLMSLTR